ncbi:hypothetical protein BLNAU_4751 [Blattamonas nauphoetae]|uniref:Uncharacterized protein n=1 Tax=Blattamonas nauphoetae TaxID=2049346 RepID=A0ABQ9Y8W3_9EUKA|nr:hypothetical protein BLNAU_4751 [Blattamonas nauphoetae]
MVVCHLLFFICTVSSVPNTPCTVSTVGDTTATCGFEGNKPCTDVGRAIANQLLRATEHSISGFAQVFVVSSGALAVSSNLTYYVEVTKGSEHVSEKKPIIQVGRGVRITVPKEQLLRVSDVTFDVASSSSTYPLFSVTGGTLMVSSCDFTSSAMLRGCKLCFIDAKQSGTVRLETCAFYSLNHMDSYYFITTHNTTFFIKDTSFSNVSASDSYSILNLEYSAVTIFNVNFTNAVTSWNPPIYEDSCTLVLHESITFTNVTGAGGDPPINAGGMYIKTPQTTLIQLRDIMFDNCKSTEKSAMSCLLIDKTSLQEVPIKLIDFVFVNQDLTKKAFLLIETQTQFIVNNPEYVEFDFWTQPDLCYFAKRESMIGTPKQDSLTTLLRYRSSTIYVSQIQNRIAGSLIDQPRCGSVTYPCYSVTYGLSALKNGTTSNPIRDLVVVNAGIVYASTEVSNVRVSGSLMDTVLNVQTESEATTTDGHILCSSQVSFLKLRLELHVIKSNAIFCVQTGTLSLESLSLYPSTIQTLSASFLSMKSGSCDMMNIVLGNLIFDRDVLTVVSFSKILIAKSTFNGLTLQQHFLSCNSVTSQKPPIAFNYCSVLNLTLPSASSTFVSLNSTEFSLLATDVEGQSGTAGAGDADVCSWTSGAMKLSQCVSSLTSLNLISLPFGALVVSGGSLVLTQVTLANNGESTTMTGTRKNIRCMDGASVTIDRIYTERHVDGLWLSTDGTCTVEDVTDSKAALGEGGLELKRAQLFRPYIQNTTVENDTITITGTGLFPCLLEVTLFAVLEDATTLPTLPCTDISTTDGTQLTCKFDAQTVSVSEWEWRLNMTVDGENTILYNPTIKQETRKVASATSTVRIVEWIVLGVLAATLIVVVILFVVQKSRQIREINLASREHPHSETTDFSVRQSHFTNHSVHTRQSVQSQPPRKSNRSQLQRQSSNSQLKRQSSRSQLQRQSSHSQLQRQSVHTRRSKATRHSSQTQTPRTEQSLLARRLAAERSRQRLESVARQRAAESRGERVD